jgi:hypothetical protein
MRNALLAWWHDLARRRLHSARVPAFVLLPLVSGLLSVGFAMLLGVRFGRRRRPYHLVWAFALLCFGVSCAAEALGGLVGWTDVPYRWWYLCGAMCVAAYLGAGSLYLHPQMAVAWLTVGSVIVGCLPALASGFLVEAAAGLGAAGLLAGVLLGSKMRFADAALVMLLLGTVVAAARVFSVPVDATLLPRPEQIVTGQVASV